MAATETKSSPSSWLRPGLKVHPLYILQGDLSSSTSNRNTETAAALDPIAVAAVQELFVAAVRRPPQPARSSSSAMAEAHPRRPSSSLPQNARSSSSSLSSPASVKGRDGRLEGGEQSFLKFIKPDN